MKDLYQYFANKTGRKDLIKTLQTLAKMEEEHERFAKGLKWQSARTSKGSR